MPNDPERDRRLAARPRDFGRRATPLGSLVEQLMTSERMRRMRRFAPVIAALREVLGEERLAEVEPQRIEQGQLFLEVRDSVLLAELRCHRAQALLDALAVRRCGVNRIVWKTGSRARP